ncbi:MAG TPA: response regulator [Phenylobacterium sp.]
MTTHILVADDDRTNRIVFEQTLGALGHRVTVAEDGASAMQLLSFQTFDLALLDLHMPRMSGLDVLGELRAFEGPNRWIPAICVTADVMTRLPYEYLDLGFQGFLAKPVQLAKLAVTIDKALAQSIAKLRREKLGAKLAGLHAAMSEANGESRTFRPAAGTDARADSATARDPEFLAINPANYIPG